MIGKDMQYLLGDRSLRALTALPELRGAAGVLGSDVEGPLFLGDFIAEALSARVRPRHGAIEAVPSYGQILYQEGYAAFTETTIGLRRPLRRVGGGPPGCRYTWVQEGTDTILALPMLLASGVDYAYLDGLARGSAATPGAAELVRELERRGMPVVGITTAPQQPYRNLVERNGLLARERIIGSPFPLNETRELLQGRRRWDDEIGMVCRYLDDAFAIIDGYSEIHSRHGERSRRLSDAGRRLLRARFLKHCRDELGISYDPAERRGRTASTLLGEIIEACAMVGDRAKAAIALNLGRSLRDGALVAMGDGGNDVQMLRRAPLSIGVNGPDAARAAKIAVVTADMGCVLPILRQIIEGERDVNAIIGRAQAEVGEAAWIHRGGEHLAPESLARHRDMKRRLRGEFVTY
ncbi:hypothetical protein [Chromobacterium sphagni]|uniref:Haloacid dehalogenase n=1 Tax=Chromobacterium sphagni TaxID=1903179 RepID=A0ABX3CEU3_9NEIS|nr:hypothetical protein [Chromobacterium sphagni]OHX20611.1 hypothetical protein BI344_15220 [Chromobacterium sphagni]